MKEAGEEDQLKAEYENKEMLSKEEEFIEKETGPLYRLSLVLKN